MTPHPQPPSSPSKTILTIGSLIFEITCQKGLNTKEFNPAYKQFITSKVKTDGKTVPVQLLLREGMPDLASLTKIFDTAQSWSMYTDSHDKFIAFHPSTANKPEWVARIDGDLQSITVFCQTNDCHTETSQQRPINPVSYPLDQILLMNLLVGKGLLIHAAGVIFDDKGYVFAGHSGAGKSTLCKLLGDNKDFKILSDDRIVILKDGQDFLMYGTPWPGEAGIAVNESAELHGMFFLKHNERNHIRKLPAADALNYFFKVASLPLYDETDMNKSLDFCEELLGEINTFELNFRPGPEIVEEIISFVSG